MYGTREALCVQLKKMFTRDEPLLLLVWTEEGIREACREHHQAPDEAEVRALMKAMGERKMADYHRSGVTCAGVSELLIRQREAAVQVSVPAALLSRVLRDYARELDHRTSQAWEAGAPETESVKQARSDVLALTEALAA
ncbi:DUF1380 family protein [Enterobacteriaceae bacterium RIT814]|uniref:DUF1380 family protein n=1 Tax=uncultured Leclercia sp. TaxID=332959 RepID=UPI0025957622|nr:DUF1380 family protein [uncultured Leclercia sp.]MBM6608386.1 DUF1380 family protein [Enterobacteriaceae bacterium RIT 814]